MSPYPEANESSHSHPTSMHPQSPRKLLQYLLDDNPLSVDDLVSLLGDSRFVAEGTLLEYKSGKMSKKELTTLSDEIRQLVTSFANSDGGVAIIGVENSPPHTIDGFIAPGGSTPAEWAARVLNTNTAPLIPVPHYSTIVSDGKQVLVIAVPRAAQFVHYIKGGHQTYALRNGDCTFDCDPSLVHDLLLGRRAQTVIEIASYQVVTRHRQVSNARGLKIDLYDIDFEVILENQSLITSRDVVVGVVSWSQGGGAPPLSSYLRSYIEVGQAPDLALPPLNGIEWIVQHKRSEATTVAPLTTANVSVRGVSQLDLSASPGTLNLALYVIAEGTAPRWYSVEHKFQFLGDDRTTGRVTIPVPAYSARPRLWID